MLLSQRDWAVRFMKTGFAMIAGIRIKAPDLLALEQRSGLGWRHTGLAEEHYGAQLEVLKPLSIALVPKLIDNLSCSAAGESSRVQ